MQSIINKKNLNKYYKKIILFMVLINYRFSAIFRVAIDKEITARLLQIRKEKQLIGKAYKVVKK